MAISKRPMATHGMSSVIGPLSTFLTFPRFLEFGTIATMAILLQLPRELLVDIFCFLEDPEAYSMTCRALNAFPRDPPVVSRWILCSPNPRMRWHNRILLRVSFLDKLVIPLSCWLKSKLKRESLRCVRIFSHSTPSCVGL